MLFFDSNRCACCGKKLSESELHIELCDLYDRSSVHGNICGACFDMYSDEELYRKSGCIVAVYYDEISIQRLRQKEALSK